MNLPDRIRAIPCKVPAYENAYGAYERGHRAALEFAATLAEGTGEADAERLDTLLGFPRLTEIEIATAVTACRDAGAVNAANALSKHITRLQIEIDLRKESHA